MALSARDLYFAVRVEDRATRPLKRIAADFRALGKAGLASRKADVASAQLMKQRATSARVLAEAELQRSKTGSRGLGIDLRRARAATATHRARLAEVGLLNKARGQYDAIGRAEERAAKARQLPLAGMPQMGLSSAQVRNIRGQREAAVETARRHFNLTSQQAGLSAGAIEQAILKEKQLIAVEAERIAREAELRNIILSRAEAERIATANVAAANRQLERFPMDRLAGAGRIISHIGRGLATIGAIGTLTFGFLAKGAADFSTEATLAATQSTSLGNNTVKAVQKNSAFIQKEIQKLLSSGRVIAGSKEQTDAIYQIFSGLTLPEGDKGLREGIKLLKEFNTLTTANAGLVTLEESTRAGIILINDFGISLNKVPDALNTMQAAVRFGRMTMSEFIGTLNQAAPAAKAAGFSFDDMAGAITFLSRKFPSLRMGATGYARLVETFAKDEVVSGLKRQGIVITDVHNRLLPLDEIMTRIIRKRPELAKGGIALQNFFKDVSGSIGFVNTRRAFTFLAQDLPGFSFLLKVVKNDNDELRKSFAAAQASPGIKWKEFTVQAQGFALEIGTGVLPAIAKIADQVRDAGEAFNELSPHTKQMIGYFGILISVGTLLFGVISIIAGGITSLVAAVGLLLGSRGLGLLGAETGLTVVQFSALFTAAAILITIFIKYPGTIHAIVDALGGLQAAIETVIALLVVQKFGLFASIISEAIAATAAVTALEVALAAITGIGTIIVTIIVLRKLIDAPGSPVHGLAPETHDFVRDFKRTFRHPTDLHAQVQVFADVGKVLWTHDPNRQIDQDLRDKIASLGPIKVESGKKAVIDMRRQFEVRWPDPTIALRRAASKAASALGVVVTPQFTQLFIEFRNAQTALDKLKETGAGAMKIFEAQARLASAIQALKDFSKEAVAAAKAALTASKRLSDQQVMIEGRKVQKLKKLAENAGTFAAWKTYFDALKKLQDSATSEQMQAMEQILDVTTSKTKDATTKLQDAYKDVFSNIKSQFDTFQSQNESAFGELFQGPWMQSAGMRESIDWGYQLKTKDLLKDQKMQVNAFRTWRKDIDALRRRGLPKSMVDKILALGPEQTRDQVNLLKKMTPEQLAEYKRMWLAGQREIHRATMADLKNQLDSWRKHGRQIALAIARGLRDENVTLENSLKSLILRIFPGLTPGAKPKKGATGMVVPGSGSGDTVHSLLTPGEIVLNDKHQKGLRKRLGVSGGPHQLFSHIQKFQDGGVVRGTKFADLSKREQFRRITDASIAHRINRQQEEAALSFWHLKSPHITKKPDGFLKVLDSLIGSPLLLGVRPSRIMELGRRAKRGDYSVFSELGMAVEGPGRRGAKSITGEKLFYHGTAGRKLAAPGVQLSLKYADEHGLYGPGIYFTDNMKIASSYAESGRQVMSRTPKTFFGESESDIYTQANQILVDDPNLSVRFHNIRQVTRIDETHGGKSYKRWQGDYEFVRVDPNAAHVRVAKLAIKKAFDVEKRNEIPVEELTAAVKSAGLLGEYTHRSNWEEMVGMHLKRNPHMNNDQLYSMLSESFGGGHGAHAVLRNLGYDAIKYPGGKNLGGPRHEVYVIIKSARQIRSAFPKRKAAARAAVDAESLTGDEIFFHGTSAKFHEFSAEKMGTGRYGKGIYFTSARGLAKRYSQKNRATADVLTPTIMKAHLSVRNPFDADRVVNRSDIANIYKILRQGGLNHDAPGITQLLRWSNRFHPKGFSVYQAIKAAIGEEDANVILRNAGFDSIRYQGELHSHPDSTNYVLFDPAQVLKLAKGGVVPKMAQGGIVTRATNIIAGERGPEAIIPLKYGSPNTATRTPTQTPVEQHVPGETVHYHITTTGTKEDVARQAKDAYWHHKTRFKR